MGPIGRPIGGPIGRPIGRPIGGPIGRPIGGPIGGPISGPIRDPNGGPAPAGFACSRTHDSEDQRTMLEMQHKARGFPDHQVLLIGDALHLLAVYVALAARDSNPHATNQNSHARGPRSAVLWSRGPLPLPPLFASRRNEGPWALQPEAQRLTYIYLAPQRAGFSAPDQGPWAAQSFPDPRGALVLKLQRRFKC